MIHLIDFDAFEWLFLIDYTANASPGAKNMPLPPIPQNGTELPKRAPAPRPVREKKIYVAAYDYKPCEEGDLELVTVSSIVCLL